MPFISLNCVTTTDRGGLSHTEPTEYTGKDKINVRVKRLNLFLRGPCGLEGAQRAGVRKGTLSGSFLAMSHSLCDRNALMTDLTQKLREISPGLFEKTPVLFAYLYGSYAKGLPHPFSDLDVGVFVDHLDTGASLNLELSLSLRIDEELDHIVQSEVRVLNRLPLIVKGRILGDAELVYCRDENRRVEFETQVRKAYFDFLPVIQQYQSAYRERALSEKDHGIL
jgi:uncharacterized protein